MCGDSAKVQLNSGILERRRLDFDRALTHFDRAQDIDPTYCEPTYWRGLTLINQGAWSVCQPAYGAAVLAPLWPCCRLGAATAAMYDRAV